MAEEALAARRFPEAAVVLRKLVRLDRDSPRFREAAALEGCIEGSQAVFEHQPARVARRHRQPPTRDRFGAGMLAGMVFFTGAFWWVNVAMVTFGGMPNWLSIPALELLVAWCAFHWAIAAGLVRLIERGLGWSMGWTIGPVWMATELMRNYFCSGFPWANLGYTQTRNLWFHQVASLVETFGTTFSSGSLVFGVPPRGQGGAVN